MHRADNFGSGDGDRAVVLLIALIRWTSWPPITFYTQLYQSAISCLAQETNAKYHNRSALLWRAFIVGRVSAAFYIIHDPVLQLVFSDRTLPAGKDSSE